VDDELLALAKNHRGTFELGNVYCWVSPKSGGAKEGTPRRQYGTWRTQRGGKRGGKREGFSIVLPAGWLDFDAGEYLQPALRGVWFDVYALLDGKLPVNHVLAAYVPDSSDRDAIVAAVAALAGVQEAKAVGAAAKKAVAKRTAAACALAVHRGVFPPPFLNSRGPPPFFLKKKLVRDFCIMQKTHTRYFCARGSFKPYHQVSVAC
jgi:hypothetical protein